MQCCLVPQSPFQAPRSAKPGFQISGQIPVNTFIGQFPPPKIFEASQWWADIRHSGLATRSLGSAIWNKERSVFSCSEGLWCKYKNPNNIDTSIPIKYLYKFFEHCLSPFSVSHIQNNFRRNVIHTLKVRRPSKLVNRDLVPDKPQSLRGMAVPGSQVIPIRNKFTVTKPVNIERGEFPHTRTVV